MLIPKIDYPEGPKSQLREIAERLLTKDGYYDQRNQSWKLKDGMTKKQHIADIYLFVIIELNEMIGNMNIALSDIDHLLEIDFQLERNEERFRFLIRMFLYEYGRTEDIYNYFLSALEGAGILNREERRKSRQSFHEWHKPFKKIRNTLLHDRMGFSDDNYRKLMAIKLLKHLDEKLINKTTREKLDAAKIFKDMVSTKRNTLYKAGLGLREFWSIVLIEGYNMIEERLEGN